MASLCELFQHTAAAHAGEMALRASDGSVELTWHDYAERVRTIAGGLASLGIGRGDVVGIMLTNRPEFHLVDMAVLHLGAAPFSVYNTSSVEQISYLFRNARNTVVVTERQFIDRIKAASGSVEDIVCVDGDADGAIALARLERRDDAGFDFDKSWRAVEPTDLAALIYTSGTVGNPKGVEIEHRALLASLRAGCRIPEIAAGACSGGRLMSYLPDAHIANRYYSHYLSLVDGASITTVRELSTVAQVLPQTRPTIFGGVPAFWYKLHVMLAGLVADPAETTPTAREAIRVRLGLDAASMLIAGAAPIAPKTIEYFQSLGIEVCEGWAMSETAAAGTINRVGRNRPGSVGLPMDGVEVRVASDGELLIRSAALMRGYRGDPERTREALIDGWYHTGDIGQIDDEGCVRIIDRKKDLIINSSGKNISPANIEAAVQASLPLAASIVAVGEARPYVVALLTLDPIALAAFARSRGIVADAPADLVAHPEVDREVAEAIDRANSRLSRTEQIKYFRILAGTWAPGGDELTPTNKLRRRSIAGKYATEIDALYVRGRQTPGEASHHALAQQAQNTEVDGK
ncbi:AMP-dependent synthetase/ligase [Dactylosporangium sp. NPDC051484]|uniref:AMP-dependent synthetase/ligase n=1 Tax=Dactylosporangium sp. NPDC051484 TaxID=3154942 RepID=UPI00344DC9E9